MPWNMGPWELAIILVIVLLLFGAKRLPEMGKSLGTGIREFKKSISAINEDDSEKKESEKDAAKIEENKEA
ncbi:MAG: twin-arginine translocase TatA/TatE family subunit [Candidatus Hinthialibacter antarcticus]|nr:twin-arginine translocase TatA/TatE family subunit [Candidatus Hinthialibacter antarcticus]